MFKNSRSNGAGRRNSTPSKSRSKFHYIGSPLSARNDFHIVALLAFICHCDKLCTNVLYAVLFRLVPQFLCPTVCVYGGTTVPQGGGRPSLGDRPPGGGRGPSSLGWGRTRGGRVSEHILVQSCSPKLCARPVLLCIVQVSGQFGGKRFCERRFVDCL